MNEIQGRWSGMLCMMKNGQNEAGSGCTRIWPADGVAGGAVAETKSVAFAEGVPFLTVSLTTTTTPPPSSPPPLPRSPYLFSPTRLKRWCRCRARDHTHHSPSLLTPATSSLLLNNDPSFFPTATLTASRHVCVCRPPRLAGLIVRQASYEQEHKSLQRHRPLQHGR